MDSEAGQEVTDWIRDEVVLRKTRASGSGTGTGSGSGLSSGGERALELGRNGVLL
jgi:hypothetical protein